MRTKQWFAVLTTAFVSIGMVAMATGPAHASSHREAPLISQDPTADNTDLYAFRDPNNPAMLDIIAGYIGLELPQGGPNFSKFGDDVLYEIHIDNNGDVEDDITYQFRFRTTVVNGDSFLYNTNQITGLNQAAQNVQQVYSVQRVDSSGPHMLLTNVPTPPVNIGPRSTPNYESKLADPAITALPGGGQVFAGQREDPFFVDLGSVFDLLGLRPFNSAHAISRPTSAGVDGLSGYNVHVIALQVPIASVSKNGNVPTTVDDPASFVGIYAAASRQRVKVLSVIGDQPRNAGRFVQVSRLGLPLINEVLIPLANKDLWNGTDPADDAQFFPTILDPEPTKLMHALYGLDVPPGGFDANGNPKRTDIVDILTGQGAGLTAAHALPPADLVRVNLAIPPVTGTSANRLAILQGDDGGFPNGRRLTDDVVDIELRLLAGGTPFTPTFNKSPNNALSDGVDADDVAPLTSFPYVPAPFDGYSESPPGHSAP